MPLSLLQLFSMKPGKTEESLPGEIFALRSARNRMYLVRADNGYIAIDAGSSKAQIQEGLDQFFISPETVTHLFLTHSDYDHTTALPLFPNAKLYLSEDERVMLDGSTRRGGMSRFNHLPQGIAAIQLIPLTDGQTLTICGRTVTCVKASGHTVGSMVYSVDGKYLFTGDAFKYKQRQFSVHPFTMNPEQAALSIHKLKKYAKGQMVFTAHYGAFSIEENQL